MLVIERRPVCLASLACTFWLLESVTSLQIISLLSLYNKYVWCHIPTKLREQKLPPRQICVTSHTYQTEGTKAPAPTNMCDVTYLPNWGANPLVPCFAATVSGWPLMVVLRTQIKLLVDSIRWLQQAILQFSPCLHHLKNLVNKGSCIPALKSCYYMLTIGILVLVTVSFLPSYL